MTEAPKTSLPWYLGVSENDYDDDDDDDDIDDDDDNGESEWLKRPGQAFPDIWAWVIVSISLLTAPSLRSFLSSSSSS